MKTLSSILVMAFLLVSNAQAADETSQQKLLKNAKVVMEEIMSAPDLGIPSGLMSRAQAVIVFPSMIKGGFLIGARYGKGVATARELRRLEILKTVVGDRHRSLQLWAVVLVFRSELRRLTWF
jgi:lipid-binding SYLF domain-containing protein